MSAPEQSPRKPLFAAIAIGCALLAGTLTVAASRRMVAGETLDGYSTFSVMISCMVAMSLSGLITGQIGLIRGEKPLVMPILALVLNGAIFILIVTHIPR